MIVIREIVALQDEMTARWHVEPDVDFDDASGSVDGGISGQEIIRRGWLGLVARQHRANFDLWHIEDEARAPGASDADLAAVKRRVDQTNQLRNDLVEDLDRVLLTWLEARGLPNPEAALHSETPGQIIDRLSILALKIYHTRQETERTHAPAGHSERNRERLAILEKQRRDLAGCLDVLWKEILDKTRRFQLYRQLKMYNDPSLNPAIYGKAENERTSEPESKV
jgi:hypothetical protein